MTTTEQNIKKAIHLDCLQLIENFIKNKNPEFQLFCKEWKLMHFHHIFTGQLNEIDMVYTTIEVFQLCKRLLIKENSKLTKIGSIYLLYSLYYKQPAELYVKIKVNLTTWRIINEFLDSLANDDNCIQVRYIFWKLVSENAFRFVESDIYYGLEPFFNKEQEYTYQKLSEVPEENILHNDIINLTHKNEGFIKGFELLQKKYNDMKNVINENKQNEPSYIPTEPTKFIQEIQNDILSINEIFDAKTIPEENINDNRKNKNIYERRKAIRNKAYSKHNQIPGTSKTTVIQNNDEKYFTEEVNDDSDIDNLPDIKNVEHIRKVSKLQQIKTLLQDPLPDDIKKELGDKNY